MIAVPYCGPAPDPSAVLAAWNLDPALLAGLAIATWLLRAQPLRVHAGMALLWVAYVSPICALSAGLFSARSIHHLLIVFGAAPLLAGLLRQRLQMPLWIATALHIAVFWAWHVPGIYSWALASDAAYWAGQAALLGTGMLLWAAIARAAAPAALLALVAIVMQMGLLGALITFAPDPLYAPHFLTTGQYGLSALEDQQLAGLLMWVGSLPLTLLAGWTAVRRMLPAPVAQGPAFTR